MSNEDTGPSMDISLSMDTTVTPEEELEYRQWQSQMDERVQRVEAALDTLVPGWRDEG
jgi:antibiotic biosynthesis monooxygenase (ABM) superfamily enzyme